MRHKARNLEESNEKLDGKSIPKDILCKAYLPQARLGELYVRAKRKSLKHIVDLFHNKNVIELSGFINLDLERDEIIKGILIDVSRSNGSLAEIVEDIESIDGVLEVKFSDNVLNGLIIDELFFPLTVGGERSFTLRVESFGAILKRLYEKFGTGAAVILYEMGLGMGESKFKSVVNRYHVDKQTAVKIILAERSAKGWCITRLEELNTRGAIVLAQDLFECMPFRDKQDKPISQLFRGYLTGIFQQLYGRNVSVTETECIAKGDNACKFVIEAGK
ncbi:MAG: V4R domain-containing protein [Thermoproteota archaeon]